MRAETKLLTDHKPYADKYFLRANEILKAKGLNPWVNMQVFVRKGPGKAAGIDEAVDYILNHSNLEEVGGRIYGKREGQDYVGKETQMNIIVPIQEIVELETGYLGVIARAVTKTNGGGNLDFAAIGKQMREVVALVGSRPVLYFGARHWHYEEDKALARLAFENGIREVATDNGAKDFGKWGVGTIPHSLENIFAWKYGVDRAIVESTKAFDRVIPENIPRVALIDYANREITDSLATARELNGNLAAVRVDTCGENLAEGGVIGDRKYWQGNGVTVEGVYALRRALNENGFENVGIYLSSGFSNPEKVRAFNEGERRYGIKLYDGIGAGFLDGVRCATADVVAVGNCADEVDFYTGDGVSPKSIIHKVGRPPRPNNGLDLLVGSAA
ncbi:MAG: nicotinate phosphoribosyltransferase [Nanoarchaeota archaeon]|nr:nicotinate phosphoribosyltransferase [Nanoarchaeota archaeon]